MLCYSIDIRCIYISLCFYQVLKPSFEPRDRVVPKISTQVQERVVHVPQATF